jgi:hypothetical protein
MMPSFSRTLLALSLPALLLAACQSVDLAGLPGVAVDKGPRYSQLKFEATSSGVAAMAALSGGASFGALPSAATMPTTASPGGPASSASVYDNGLTVTEAKVLGMTGTFHAVYDGLVAPIVKEWAADAALKTAFGITDGKGQNLTLPSGPSSMFGWMLAYYSPARQEMLAFMVGSTETKIAKVSWKAGSPYAELFKSNGTSILLDQVKQGSNEAIVKISRAVADTAATFQDPDAANVVSGSTMFGAMPMAGFSMMPGSTEVTAIPADTAWMLFITPEWLKGDRTRMVWSAMVMPMPTSSSSTVSVDAPIMGGMARVDAGTGAVLSLVRPRRMAVAPQLSLPASLGR